MKWIIDAIEEVGTKYNYDLNEMLIDLNVTVIELKNDNILLKSNLSFCYIDLEGKAVIFIKEGLKPLLKQFLLFHELGHIILHPKSYTIGTYHNSDMNIGKLEQQANFFALHIIQIIAGLKGIDSLEMWTLLVSTGLLTNKCFELEEIICI